MLTLDHDLQERLLQEHWLPLGVVVIQLGHLGVSAQAERVAQVVGEQGPCLRDFLTIIAADRIELCPLSSNLREDPPSSEHPRILISPAVMAGQPTLKGTQITVAFLAEQIARGVTTRELLVASPQLTSQRISAARLYYHHQLIHEHGYPCPCCGYLVHERPPGSFAICPICFWEDDASGDDPLLSHEGANHVSLLEGQQNYFAFGACEERVKPYVRPPLPDEHRAAGWRPIDPAHDQIDQILSPHESKKNPTAQRTVRLSVFNYRSSAYYWSPTYWRHHLGPEQATPHHQTPPAEERP